MEKMSPTFNDWRTTVQDYAVTRPEYVTNVTIVLYDADGVQNNREARRSVTIYHDLPDATTTPLLYILYMAL